MLRRVIWLRSLAAIVIALCLYTLLLTVVGPQWSDALVRRLRGPLGQQGAVFAMVGLFTVIPIVVIVGIYAAVDRYMKAKEGCEFETRCRKCRHILRSITEPRCPECGERI